MKKGAIILALAGLLLAGCAENPKVDSPYVSYRGDTLVVNTTELGKGITGYGGEVPLEVKVVKGKIADITPLPNHESSRFLDRALGRLKPEWVGKSIKAAAKADPDAVSGVTLSSNAIKKNVSLALKELEK